MSSHYHDVVSARRCLAAGLVKRVSQRLRGRRHVAVIGAHPQSFPDTHGSPLMGMGYAAAAAAWDAQAFRSLMDANRWWFALAECPDGTFYYQPNRDNAGYGPRSRVLASAVTAFILGIPDHALALTGRAPDADAKR